MEPTVPILRNKHAFEEALKRYKISKHGREVLANTPFVALSGIAGGGRNTVIRRLAEKYNYVFAISDTTRPPKLRDGRMEQHGVDYYFRSEEDMLRDINNGEYIEAELIHNQQVSGTSIREVERVAETDAIPVHDFEYLGIGNVMLAKPDAIIIGLVPPSYEEWLRRLNNRETVHNQEFHNRLVTAERVLESMLEKPYFHLVVNDSTDHCADVIKSIVDGKHAESMEKEARTVVEGLLQSVRQALHEAA